jgi:hypothetical protein
LSVLGDTDGTVGHGVWTEVHDAWGRQIPVRWEAPGPCRLLVERDLAVIKAGTSLRRYARPGWAA